MPNRLLTDEEIVKAWIPLNQIREPKEMVFLEGRAIAEAQAVLTAREKDKEWRQILRDSLAVEKVRTLKAVGKKMEEYYDCVNGYYRVYKSTVEALKEGKWPK